VVGEIQVQRQLPGAPGPLYPGAKLVITNLNWAGADHGAPNPSDQVPLSESITVKYKWSSSSQAPAGTPYSMEFWTYNIAPTENWKQRIPPHQIGTVPQTDATGNEIWDGSWHPVPGAWKCRLYLICIDQSRVRHREAQASANVKVGNF
jgi:hypothetical protein